MRKRFSPTDTRVSVGVVFPRVYDFSVRGPHTIGTSARVLLSVRDIFSLSRVSAIVLESDVSGTLPMEMRTL